MRYCVFDLEADALLDEASKIYCLSYQFEDEDEVKTITDQERIKKFFGMKDVMYVGHNIIVYDIPVSQKILGAGVSYDKCVDTLGLSWHLFEGRVAHGLASWGEDMGHAKTVVSEDQWAEGDIQLMVERCSNDVIINMWVWRKQKALLEQLYDGDQVAISKLIKYISFKLDCVREQETVGLKIDIPRVEKGIEKLEAIANEKVEALKKIMPKIPIVKQKTYPKKPFKKDGSLSSIGESWVKLVKEQGLPEGFIGVIEYIDGYEEPNPNSVKQKKDWLFSLGWVPENIKLVRDKKTKQVTHIPQVVDKNDNTQVCMSVKKLMGVEPGVENLNSLGVINHRLGILKGFLKNQKGGIIYPSSSGLTNTMRLKHKIYVNLPASSAPYAEDIRASIIARDGEKLINSDLSSAEDKTKRHWIYPYDPEYVMQMEDPNFSPHTDIAVQAGLMTKEEEEFYKMVDSMEDKSSLSPEDITEFKRLKDVRHTAKTANFSATYKVGAKTLANTLGSTESSAQKLIDAYWERNKAVLEYEADCDIKLLSKDGIMQQHIARQLIEEGLPNDLDRMWVLNKLSKQWLPLRGLRDILSTTNQSSAVYVFDVWLGLIRSKGVKIAAQYQDEWTANCPKGDVENVINIAKKSMDEANKLLKLNVTMSCSIGVGENYAEIH